MRFEEGFVFSSLLYWFTLLAIEDDNKDLCSLLKMGLLYKNEEKGKPFLFFHFF